MVKLFLLTTLVSMAAALPVPQSNVVGFTSRSVFTSGMDQPMQTFNVEYAVPVDPRYYNYYYPQHAMPVQTRQRRQIGLGGFGGLGGGMAGAQAQAQAQSQSMSNGLGGYGGFGMPLLGGLGGLGVPGLVLG